MIHFWVDPASPGLKWITGQGIGQPRCWVDWPSASLDTWTDSLGQKGLWKGPILALNLAVKMAKFGLVCWTQMGPKWADLGIKSVQEGTFVPGPDIRL